MFAQGEGSLNVLRRSEERPRGGEPGPGARRCLRERIDARKSLILVSIAASGWSHIGKKTINTGLYFRSNCGRRVPEILCIYGYIPKLLPNLTLAH